MNKTQGTVDTMGRDGKRFKLEEDGQWYSAFATSQLPRDIEVGSYVSFTYVEKGEYRNIKGNVTLATAPASTPMTGAGIVAPVATGGFVDAKGFVRKMFPVPPLHPDRSIIRQNSLTHATTVLRDRGWKADNCQEYAEAAIDVARIFEAYSTGELDNELAEAEIAKALASETSRY